MQSPHGFSLTPIQQGMMYHHLGAPHSGVDIEQMVMTLREPLDAKALRLAWDQLVNAHPALQSRFDWENSPNPVRLEDPEVAMEWNQVDLRAFPSEERSRRLDEYLERDRRRGFDLRVAPLARAALFQTGESEWDFVWTFHHILADGSTYASLIREGFARYDAIRDGTPAALPKPLPFHVYVQWLETHLTERKGRAERFWRELLKGFAAPTPLPGSAGGAHALSGQSERSFRLSAPATALLNALCRAHRVRMNALVQAAWALVLSVHGGGDDVVFGVTRACRRSTLAGIEDIVGVLINTVPVRIRLDANLRVIDWLAALRNAQESLREFERTPLLDIQRYSELPPASPLFESIVVFTPRLIGAALKELGGPWVNRDVRFVEQTNYQLTLFAYDENELLVKLAYDRARYSDASAGRLLELIRTFLETLPAHSERLLKDLPLLSARDQQTVLIDWNCTSRKYAQDRCVHELFEAQAERTPGAVALVFRDQQVTYRELNERANQIAHRLRDLGVGPGQFVGVFLHRSVNLVTAMLAALKAGAAYVPMDPAYPAERLRWMLEDTQAPVVLSQSGLKGAVPAANSTIVCLDDDAAIDGGQADRANLDSGVNPDGLAYVIFTSGSSGRPKGVMVEHQNVTNFFAGMDEHLGSDKAGTWLAVTSVSFDISVLELFWTLARGFKVVIQEEAVPGAPAVDAIRSAPSRKMDFSLFYFAADAGTPGENRYRLLLQGARFADQHGFAAVWTPERHFHAFGGLYPNPTVTSAAIATITERIQIRAGSIVLPLHDPIRVAEEWSVVDNLSQGRIGLSFASGWHANDFALMPENYRDRKEVMLRGIETIRRLWRGEAIKAKSGTGDEIDVRIFPAPYEREPPIWLTAAGNVETFRTAGAMGANILTNLLGQNLEDLAGKIAAYREARRQNGHSGPGHVSLMLHTFVGSNLEEVRRKVREPFLDYLRVSTDLIKKARWECPAFATSPGRRLDAVTDDELTEAETKLIMDHAFERYFQTSGLFGTPETCLQMVDRLKGIGVDEIACLVDFGVDSDSVIESLTYLNELRARSNPGPIEADYSIASQIRRHQVTHMQCTPSLARALASDQDSLEALRSLRKLLLGGEALPASLASVLAPALGGDLLNMYGPTETTVWSTVAKIDRSGSSITIGRPIANTQAYVVDRHARPVPMGVPGELWIGGDGVTRGYWNRPDLTEEKFVPDRFGDPRKRLYRTGDLVRCLEDGRIEFLGRLDNQVKIRGYRIEPGEIASVLEEHKAVRESLVVARENSAGDVNLIAYVGTGGARATTDATVAHWRTLWDETYSRATAKPEAATDAILNTAGWISSYTGEPIPDEEMREWAEQTARRILDLKPRRVLEIGCGTGMLLFRIAPSCEHYCGLDVSASAIELVQSEAARQGLSNLTLRQAGAHELAGLDIGSFDVVILNSVVQYFPDASYLATVIDNALPLVKEGGTIFVGDVRSLPLHEAFCTSVELERAPADLSTDELRRRIRLRRDREDELLFDPEFFRALCHRLPVTCSSKVLLKRGHHQNEMTCFRYDVLLAVGRSIPADPVRTIECRKDSTSAWVRAQVGSAEPGLAVAGITSSRVVRARTALELLASDACPETAGAIRNHLSAAVSGGIDPEELWAMDLPYDIELSPSNRGADLFDATFRHRAAARAPLAIDSIPVAPLPIGDWNRYTNRPVAQSLAGALVLKLKETAREKLPDFMVPATIVVLDRLPRTPNGKIDPKALPEPDHAPAPNATRYTAPQTELEMTISAVWQDLLNLDRVGVHDNFFDLGANSLTMVLANSRLRAALRKELSLIDLFRYPTVCRLAARLSEDQGGQSALRQSQERGRARIDALHRRRAAPRSGPASLPAR